ncbi:MAG: LptF/LptG family permease, partial [Odoribacter sp.]|nr:LptF/LptG family permease [Odoribacter sp.]
LLTGLAFVFSNNVLPVANLKMNALYYAIRKQKPEMSFKEGIFTNDLEKYSIKVDRIDKNTGMMYNVLIYSHKDGNGNYEVTKADSGLMKTNVRNNAMDLTLFNGHTYTDEGMQKTSARKTFPFRRLRFGEERMSIDLPDADFKRTDEDAFRSHSMMLNLSQLQHRIDSIQHYLKTKKAGETKRLLASNYQKSKSSNTSQDSVLQEKSRDMFSSPDSLFQSFDEEEQQRAVSNALQYARDVKQKNQDNVQYYKGQGEQVIRNQIEWHRKFSLSFACFIFFFIGAPLGAIIRKGGLGMPVVVSIFLFIIYYIIDMMGIRSAREAVITPQLGSWISSLILLPLGVILTYKSVKDSEMMNTDAYTNFFKKIVSFFKKKSHAGA